MDDFDEVLGWVRQAEEIITDPHRQTDVPALRHAVELLKRAMAALPPELDELQPELANMCGGALTSLFEVAPERALIDEAVYWLSQTTHPFGWANLGLALQLRYQLGRDPEDLAMAAEATYRAATADIELESFEQAGLLANYGIVLQDMFIADARRTDLLDEATAVLRSAVAAAPGHPDRYRWLGALANTYVVAYDVSGDRRLLDEAVGMLRPIRPETLPAAYRPGHLANLGGALANRFLRAGDPADLDEAVRVFREAVQQAPGTREPAGHHANLGQALWLRFRHFGGLADIDEALKWCRAAIAEAVPGQGNWAAHQVALGVASEARFERLGQRADIDTAVDAFRQAVEATPETHLDRGGRLADLSGALTVRFIVYQQPADAEEAVRRATEAVVRAEPESPARPRHLATLAQALQLRASTERPAFADEAVRAARAAGEALPQDPALAVTCLRSLADALARRHELAGDPADKVEAGAVYRRAASVVGAPSLYRAICARQGGYLIGRSDWRFTSESLAAAIELIGGLAGRSVPRSDRESFLARFTGTATDAAAAALEAGDLPRGVGVLEQGRAVLLTQILETGPDLEALRARHPQPARQLSQVGSLLDQGTDWR